MRIAFLALLICPVLAQDLNTFKATLAKNCPEYLEKYFVPGMGVAVIRGGQIVYEQGFGLADKEAKIPVTPESGFNIGSISKTVAAWGLMKLVEEGKLDLDKPVDSYLTRWHIPASKYDASGVTLRRLLSHTAGLSLHGYPGFGPQDSLPSLEESLNGNTNGSGAVQLIMPPGSQWKYSGGGYTIAQLLVEEISGQAFADYMRHTVLQPLGMNHSDYQLSPKILSHSCKAYDNWGNQTPNPRFTAQAAAGLQTTLHDLALFACAALQDGNSRPGRDVLKPETLQLMTTPAANSPNYGLGYGSVEEIKGVRMVGHGGSNRGWQAEFNMDPVKGDGIVLVTNGSNGWVANKRVFNDWAAWFYNSHQPFREPIELAVADKVRQAGVPAAITFFRKAKTEQPDQYGFNEGALNNLGYYLLGDQRVEDAIAIFKLNVETYPEASNPYDSLAEAYMIHGDRDLAIFNYKESLARDPKNSNAEAMLKKLGDEH